LLNAIRKDKAVNEELQRREMAKAFSPVLANIQLKMKRSIELSASIDQKKNVIPKDFFSNKMKEFQ